MSGARRGRLTKAEEEYIEAHAHQRPAVIALRLNRHKSTVYFALARMGLRAPIDRQFDYMRNGSRCRSFSSAEDKFIVLQRRWGATTPEIARRTSERFGHPRSAATIGIRLKQLATREESE